MRDRDAAIGLFRPFLSANNLFQLFTLEECALESWFRKAEGPVVE
jgi:hypothetical protein